jgi:cytochrome c biogenesis protein CcmG/thiol:disulfide interchange protein DsbE
MRLGAVLPLAVFALIGVLLWSGIGKDPRVLPSVLVGHPAPEFSAPELRDPNRIHSKASLAGEPYLLNVFASWCPSCRVEHPVLARYVREGKLRLVGLNWKDQRADALAWLQRFGDPYAEILYDPDGRIGIDFGVTAAPESFVIGVDGSILYKHIGPLTAEDMDTKVLPLLARTTRP